MAKAIYSMKIYLFRAQFRLTESEKNGLKRIVTFVTSKYITAWFNAPLATSAPAQDLEFLKSLLNYPDESVSKATATVFARHLWYLSARLVALAFFDERVTVETKREMVTALQQEGSEDPPRRAYVDLAASSVSRKTLADFVTTGSAGFFTHLDLDTDFLRKDPTHWEDEPSYIAAKRRVKSSASLTTSRRGVLR